MTEISISDENPKNEETGGGKFRLFALLSIAAMAGFFILKTKKQKPQAPKPEAPTEEKKDGYNGTRTSTNPFDEFIRIKN